MEWQGVSVHAPFLFCELRTMFQHQEIRNNADRYWRRTLNSSASAL